MTEGHVSLLLLSLWPSRCHVFTREERTGRNGPCHAGLHESALWTRLPLDRTFLGMWEPNGCGRTPEHRVVSWRLAAALRLSAWLCEWHGGFAPILLEALQGDLL